MNLWWNKNILKRYVQSLETRFGIRGIVHFNADIIHFLIFKTIKLKTEYILEMLLSKKIYLFMVHYDKGNP